MSQNQSNKTHKRSFKAKVSPEEYQLLLDLRKRSPAQNPPKVSMTFGERVADRFALIMGSWKFINPSCGLALTKKAKIKIGMRN